MILIWPVNRHWLSSGVAIMMRQWQQQPLRAGGKWSAPYKNVFKSRWGSSRCDPATFGQKQPPYPPQKMPTDLKCPNCDLRISVGTFHTARDGFIAVTLIPCGVCGTQHKVRHGRLGGPDQLEIQRVIVESFEPSAFDRTVVRVQKFHKPKPSLSQALEVVRNLPFTLVESLLASSALKLTADLKQVGIQARAETTGNAPNPFSDMVRSRIEYQPHPQHGDAPLPWLVATEAVPDNGVAMTCMVCLSKGSMIRGAIEALVCPACKKENLIEVRYWLT